MKRFYFTLIALLLLATPALASGAIHSTLNAELDAPKLVSLKQISPDLWLGTSIEKPMATNLFHSDFRGVEDDLGYVIGAKITYDGCWINCP
jgi:hypothetical protein